MQIDEEQLKKAILDGGLVTKTELEEITKKTKTKKQKLSDMLLTEAKISEPELRKMEAFVLGIPFVTLEKEKIDFAILSLVPETIARNYNIISYKKSEKGLEVAMLDVDDLPVIDFIKKTSGLKILPRLTDSASIKSALLQYKKSLQAEFTNIIQKEAGSLKISGGDDKGEKSEIFNEPASFWMIFVNSACKQKLAH